MHSPLTYWLAVLTITLSPSETRAQSTWLCKTEDAVGYRWADGAEKYSPQTFSSDDTFLVRPFADGDNDPRLSFMKGKPKYVLVELGSDRVLSYFYADLETSNGATSLAGSADSLFFHESNELVFQNIFGHLREPKAERTNENTPFFSVGKCSKVY